MKVWFLLSFLTFSANGYAQVENDSIASKDSLRIIHEHWMFREWLSVGVYPEIQFIGSPMIGVSASIAKLTEGEGAATSRGVNLGFEFDPLLKFYGPKASIWADVFALFIPGNAALNVIYYRQNNIGGLYLRPEIGIGIPRLHLKYGFGFRVAGDELKDVPRHSLTLGYHFSLFNSYPRH